jgi:putative membrane protein
LRSRRSDQARTLALVIVAVLITIFAVLNTNNVKVDWIVGSGKAPLIIVIVISLLVGIILTHFAERRASKRR